RRIAEEGQIGDRYVLPVRNRAWRAGARGKEQSAKHGQRSDADGLKGLRGQVDVAETEVGRIEAVGRVLEYGDGVIGASRRVVDRGDGYGEGVAGIGEYAVGIAEIKAVRRCFA